MKGLDERERERAPGGGVQPQYQIKETIYGRECRLCSVVWEQSFIYSTLSGMT
uniref:Uncharacterized protein n=1 Tax=Octopus bimaculoides TaxID=37653 RepID=A0A0L8FTG1_OCTBM